MTLDVQTILQAQRAEFFFRQFAREKPRELVTVLIDALRHNGFV
jgi:hypothetical protein